MGREQDVKLHIAAHRALAYGEEHQARMKMIIGINELVCCRLGPSTHNLSKNGSQ